MKGEAQKKMVTMISEHVSEKTNRSRDEEEDLRNRSKLFLK